jgi:hypothetical protein
MSSAKYPHQMLADFIVDTFFPQYLQYFKMVDVVNFVSFTLSFAYFCILLLCLLAQDRRVVTPYIICHTFALVFWHLPGVITFVARPDNVLCENQITRASDDNQACNVEGKALSH